MKGTSVVQPWVSELTMMQQTVALELARGPDGLTKYHISKYLCRWLRRCMLLSAMDGRVLQTPIESGGGSYAGPSYELVNPLPTGWRYRAGSFVFEVHVHHRAPEDWEEPMWTILGEYIRGADEVPHHYYRHFMHAVEVVGYKHPDARIREFWNKSYCRLVRDLHLNPETEEQMDFRLGDSRSQWIEAGDPATVA